MLQLQQETEVLCDMEGSGEIGYYPDLPIVSVKMVNFFDMDGVPLKMFGSVCSS